MGQKGNGCGILACRGYKNDLKNPTLQMDSSDVGSNFKAILIKQSRLFRLLQQASLSVPDNLI